MLTAYKRCRRSTTRPSRHQRRSPSPRRRRGQRITAPVRQGCGPCSGYRVFAYPAAVSMVRQSTTTTHAAMVRATPAMRATTAARRRHGPVAAQQPLGLCWLTHRRVAGRAALHVVAGVRAVPGCVRARARRNVEAHAREAVHAARLVLVALGRGLLEVLAKRFHGLLFDLRRERGDTSC